MKTGDQILRFGSITGENSQGLHDIASVVQHSKGVKIQNIQVKNLFSFIILRYKLAFNPLILHIFIFALYQSPLSVIVEREGGRHTLSLTPNTWSGRGLLGYACLVILFIYLFLLLLPESVAVVLQPILIWCSTYTQILCEQRFISCMAFSIYKVHRVGSLYVP